MYNNREMMELLESIRQENIKTTAAAAKTARAMRICMILMAALIVFMAVCAFGVLPKVNATVNSLNSVAEQLAASDLTGLVEDADQTLSDVSSTVKSVQPIINALKPVSYTHLDVYKRQADCRPKIFVPPYLQSPA